jgi:hypothetical protein
MKGESPQKEMPAFLFVAIRLFIIPIWQKGNWPDFQIHPDEYKIRYTD